MWETRKLAAILVADVAGYTANPAWNRFSMASVNTSAPWSARLARQGPFNEQRCSDSPKSPDSPDLTSAKTFRPSPRSPSFCRTRSASLSSGPTRRPSATRSRREKTHCS